MYASNLTVSISFNINLTYYFIEYMRNHIFFPLKWKYHLFEKIFFDLSATSLFFSLFPQRGEPRY